MMTEAKTDERERERVCMQFMETFPCEKRAQTVYAAYIFSLKFIIFLSKS